MIDPCLCSANHLPTPSPRPPSTRSSTPRQLPSLRPRSCDNTAWSSFHSVPRQVADDMLDTLARHLEPTGRCKRPTRRAAIDSTTTSPPFEQAGTLPPTLPCQNPISRTSPTRVPPLNFHWPPRPSSRKGHHTAEQRLRLNIARQSLSSSRLMQTMSEARPRDSNSLV
jgi:hypothetical protein